MQRQRREWERDEWHNDRQEAARKTEREGEKEREEIEKMTPTRSNEQIEGRSYKDYVYSPVSESASSAVFDTATPEELAKLNMDKDSRGTAPSSIAAHRPENMGAEEGSKLIQFLAAAAGKPTL